MIIPIKVKKEINDLIMQEYPKIEQVGFLSNKENRLEMAGGEFCMNATRCAIYEYSKNGQKDIMLSVSGMNSLIKGKMIDDDKVEAEITMNKKLIDVLNVNDDYVYIKLDGILIVVLDEEKSKKYILDLKEDVEKAKEKIKQLMIKKIKTDDKAIGMMFIERVEDKLKINPVVWVKDIDTLFYETACGSGSLGTAIYNYFKTKEKSAEIIQPSGFSICIELNIEEDIIKTAKVRGVVKECELVQKKD